MAQTRTPEGLSDVFQDLDARVNRDHPEDGVRLGVLLSAVGRRSYGPLLLMVGLFAISPATILPGMSSFAAAVTLLIAAQMALGLQRPWLPRQVLALKVPRGPFFAFLDRARPHVERVEGDLVRPRFEVLTRGPFVALVALCVIGAALITFPLSLVPFGPIIPCLAVVLFGVGITAKDGLLLSIGVALTALAFWFATPLMASALPL